MSYQNIFKRYEIKYLITQEQKKDIIEAMEPYMQLDEYGRTTIRNVYLDTDNYRLIRNSLEKPIYKEKIRVRSYRQVGDEDIVFVELKKKYDSVVYKRRVEETEEKAKEWLCDKKSMRLDTQIEREISYFIEYYGNLSPKFFLSYEREAFLKTIVLSYIKIRNILLQLFLFHTRKLRCISYETKHSVRMRSSWKGNLNCVPTRARKSRKRLFVLITAKRHFKHFYEMTDLEYNDYMEIVKFTREILKKLDIADEYAIINEERSNHFHTWFFQKINLDGQLWSFYI